MQSLAQRKLSKFVSQYPTQAAAALALGIQASYLSELLKGRRTFSEHILGKLGLKRTIQEAR